ncbi:tyrosine-type recombinase/integrase [Paenibacillus sp. 7541]|uniref:tyrosine-type recombinase/integrase n=1 Tax=Paenibacillus sp. 7541 TaxID=2026236 RepID=UPI000BA65E77|nr:tyrosine-type recombinase/integrase [Paenibacillus sp. 7541]PAK55398.1 integrase [Paenibacillus sp. 7541]
MARLRSIKPSDGGRAHWREVLADFQQRKKLDGISEQTALDYDRHVNLLFKRYPDGWETEIALAEAVLSHMSDQIAPATFNSRLVYLRAFFKFCVEEKHIRVNPLEGIRKRKTENRAVAIEEDVLKALLNAPDQTTFTGLRDYTLILLTLDTGIRPSEALRLIPEDFNASAHEVYVPSKIAKSRIARTLPILDVTIKSLRRLISVRPKEWADDVPIFCSYEGKPLNRHTWGDRLEVYGKRIGKHIRPYDLRHVFALEFLRNGANAFATQRALGHTTMEMTRRYIALVNDDLKAEHAKSSPLNKLTEKTTRRRSIK